MPLPFRPLSFGDVLDGAFSLYRRGFSSLVGTSLLAGALALGVDLVVARPLQGTLLPMAIGSVVYAFSWAALTWQVSALYTGRSASVNEGLEEAAARLFPLLGAWLIAFVLYGIPVLVMRGVMFGMSTRAALSGQVAAVFLLALPGLAYAALSAIAAALAFAIVPVVVLEGAGPWPAVARSFRLAGQALLRVAALVVVVMALTFLVSVGLMWGGGWIGDPAALASLPAQLLLSVARALLLPFTVAAGVLMYYDLRVRTEGLDLQMAADELAAVRAAEDAVEGDRDPAAEEDAEPDGEPELVPAAVPGTGPHPSG